ncbi:MAG: RNA polymerase sigma factor [Synoicihabitans sp.]
MKMTDNHENAGKWIAEAMREHQAPLVRYATRLLGGDGDRAQDVVQDAFLRLCQQPRADVQSHVVEWLYTVCRNRSVDVIRKEGRMRAFAEGEVETVRANESRPGRALEAAETQAAVLDLIDQLPPNQQEVIRLKFQSGFSYKEISRITKLSVGNVGYLIHTAVKQLRADMAAQQS